MQAGLISDASAKILQMSEPEDALSIIDFEHKKIHEGRNFFCTQSYTAVPDGERRAIILDSPAGAHHLMFGVYLSNGGTIEVYEDSDVVNGAVIPFFNSNRASLIECSMNLYELGVITDLGTLIYTESFPDGSGPSTNRVSSTSRNELILKPGIKYVIGAISGSAGSTINIKIDWYMI